MRALWLCPLALALLELPAAAADDDKAPPTVDHNPVAEARPNQPIEIKATIRDASGVTFPRLYYRTVGKTSYNQMTLVARAGGLYIAVIPSFSVTTNGIEYYIEAFDKQGNGPAHHGTAQKPHRVAVRKKKAVATTPPKPAAGAGGTGAAGSSGAGSSSAAATSTPWYKRWWIWAIGGAVIAGSATAIAIAASGGGDSGGGATIVVDAPLPAPRVQP